MSEKQNKKIVIISRLDIGDIPLCHNDQLDITHNVSLNSSSAGVDNAYNVTIPFGKYLHNDLNNDEHVQDYLFLGYELSIKPLFVYSSSTDKVLIKHGKMTVAQLEFNNRKAQFSK